MAVSNSSVVDKLKRLAGGKASAKKSVPVSSKARVNRIEVVEDDEDEDEGLGDVEDELDEEDVEEEQEEEIEEEVEERVVKSARKPSKSVAPASDEFTEGLVRLIEVIRDNADAIVARLRS